VTFVSEDSLRRLLDEGTVESPYWQGLEAGALLFPRCRRCANAWLPPRDECPSCLAADWEWEKASGQGRLISWVVYHVAYHEAFADRLPYTVAIVELVEGPRLITNLIDTESSDYAADAAVSLVVERDGGLALARFRLS
jgi:uncharacterized OB-fold protein